MPNPTLEEEVNRILNGEPLTEKQLADMEKRIAKLEKKHGLSAPTAQELNGNDAGFSKGLSEVDILAQRLDRVERHIHGPDYIKESRSNDAGDWVHRDDPHHNRAFKRLKNKVDEMESPPPKSSLGEAIEKLKGMPGKFSMTNPVEGPKEDFLAGKIEAFLKQAEPQTEERALAQLGNGLDIASGLSAALPAGKQERTV